MMKKEPFEPLLVMDLKPGEYEKVRTSVPYSGSDCKIPLIVSFYKERGRILELLGWRADDTTFINDGSRWIMSKK